MSESIKERILNALVEAFKISGKDLKEARELSKEKSISLDQALIDKELITEHDVLAILTKELSIPFINLNKYKLDPSLQEFIPEKVAKQYNIVPLSALEDTLTIVTADPLNVFALDDLKNITGKVIDFVISTKTDIAKAIASYYGIPGSTSVSEVTQDFQMEDFEIVSEDKLKEKDDSVVDESETAPIIRMVNLVIKEAISQRASDIHIEPYEGGMRVRYRIDGVLRDVLKIPKEMQNGVTVRIKILSRLDITNSNTPQDGRFKLKIGPKEVDFRVSLLPTTFGQKVVMRILDKGNLSTGLDGLGLSEKAASTFKSAVQAPFGMILVTGPTGSGKSTTLYSIINEINTVDKNIITVEDPVEYLVEGLTQIQSRSEIGLTFAEGLRAILRQSPDVVMVGEIRDNETADIAIKASLTGQLVFSTLHTNDSAGALTRLVDMDVEPFLVASSLVLVSAQRLCRKICDKCKEEVKVTKEMISKMSMDLAPNMKFYQGKGCKACRETGYFGRISIVELLEVDDEIRNLLIQGKSSDIIKEYACKEKSMDTLWDDALDKCKKGLTTLEEVLRVTSSG